MLTRRELLERGAAIGGGALALGRVPSAWARAPKPPVAGMNIVMFVTDQERAIQHFPRGWSRRHLPGFTRLQRHGLTFENAFCNACMCSPTRATLLTGYFTAQHGVKYTLEEDMSDEEFPQVELLSSFKNLATVMAGAGYNVVYKGKSPQQACRIRMGAVGPKQIRVCALESAGRWCEPGPRPGGRGEIQQRRALHEPEGIYRGR